jgi:hypothetical protein
MIIKTGGSVSLRCKEISIITLKQNPHDEALLLLAFRYTGARQLIINYFLRNMCTNFVSCTCLVREMCRQVVAYGLSLN